MPFPGADKGSADYEGAESDLSFGLIHCSQTRSQLASSRLWLLASEHEREIYIDLSGCLHCTGQKFDMRCFTKEIKELQQTAQQTQEHKNAERKQRTGYTQLNKYDRCIDKCVRMPLSLPLTLTGNIFLFANLGMPDDLRKTARPENLHFCPLTSAVLFIRLDCFGESCWALEMSALVR